MMGGGAQRVVVSGLESSGQPLVSPSSDITKLQKSHPPPAVLPIQLLSQDCVLEVVFNLAEQTSMPAPLHLEESGPR